MASSAADDAAAAGAGAAALLLDPSLAQVYPVSTLFQRLRAAAASGGDGSAAPAASAARLPPALSARDFADHEQLGAGKFGRAFRVRHRASGRTCVLKEMSKAELRDENVLPQIRREIEIHTRLAHPNIIACYGFFQDAERLAFVLEHANGGTLFEELYRRGGHLPERDAALITQQVARCVTQRARHDSGGRRPAAALARTLRSLRVGALPACACATASLASPAPSDSLCAAPSSTCTR